MSARSGMGIGSKHARPDSLADADTVEASTLCICTCTHDGKTFNT